MRKYKKRTTSSKLKTYKDYLSERKKLRDRGIVLKDQMNKESFEQLYYRVRQARRTGEIKSQPWQYLISNERYVARNQARNLAKAATNLYGEKFTQQMIYRLNKAQIREIGDYLNINKQSGLYGGKYE